MRCVEAGRIAGETHVSLVNTNRSDIPSGAGDPAKADSGRCHDRAAGEAGNSSEEGRDLPLNPDLNAAVALVRRLIAIEVSTACAGVIDRWPFVHITVSD